MRRLLRVAKQVPTVVFAASGGGHLEMLNLVAEAAADWPRVWVTCPGPRAASLAEAGEAVRLIRNWNRRVVGILENLRDTLAVVLRERPPLVIASGAGSVVPFCVFARVLGSRILYTETAARVTSPSAAGRVLSRIASSTFVQWPEMLDVYPRATRCRPTIFSQMHFKPRLDGQGTFVAVGGHNQPFDRLLRMVDDAAEAGMLPLPILAQAGACTYNPRNYETRPYMPPQELAEAVINSRYVISHGGSGLMMNALRANRRPMVLPRLKRYREHFDDHQTQLAGRLEQLGLVVGVGERITTGDLEQVDAPSEVFVDFSSLPPADACLRKEAERLLARGRPGPSQSSGNVPMDGVTLAEIADSRAPPAGSCG